MGLLQRKDNLYLTAKKQQPRNVCEHLRYQCCCCDNKRMARSTQGTLQLSKCLSALLCGECCCGNGSFHIKMLTVKPVKMIYKCKLMVMHIFLSFLAHTFYSNKSRTYIFIFQDTEVAKHIRGANSKWPNLDPVTPHQEHRE